jgi:hypothetical protein
MTEFTRVEFEEGEGMVFGPVSISKARGFAVGGRASQPGTSRTVARRTVGITDRRLIIEDLLRPDRSRIIPNDQVQTVSIKRERFGPRETITIARIRTDAGASVNLNLPGIEAGKESLIGDTFPYAQITEGKGPSKGVLVAIALIAGLALLCCMTLYVGPLIARLFAQ